MIQMQLQNGSNPIAFNPYATISSRIFAGNKTSNIHIIYRMHFLLRHIFQIKNA